MTALPDTRRPRREALMEGLEAVERLNAALERLGWTPPECPYGDDLTTIENQLLASLAALEKELLA